MKASTGSTDATGAWSHTSAAPTAAGNVYIVQALQDGTAADIAIDSVTNAENLAGTDNVLTKIGEFDVGSAVAASQHLWIGRALNTSAMVITGSNAGGDDVYVRVYEFNNVFTGTTLATVLENVTAGATVNSAGTSATASDASVTTLGPDRLALNFEAVNDDNALSAFTGETGGDWGFAVSPYADSGGTDGAIGLQISPMFSDIQQTRVTASGNNNINGGTGTAEASAQSFTVPTTKNLTQISLFASKTGTPTDNLIVEVRSDSQTGSVVASASLDAASIGVLSWITIPMSGTLNSGTTYFIVVSRDGARDTTNRIDLYNGGNLYAGGTASVRDSGSWSDQAWDLGFAIGYSGFTGATIDGGTGSIVDIDAWGVAGFALIGTTSFDVAIKLRSQYIDYDYSR